MAESIISIEELSKSFGDHEVLRKIDISVKKGEVICIVGSSGSGKIHPAAVHQPSGAPDQRKDSLPWQRDPGYPERD